MTRQCMDCKAPLGEICQHCGSSDVEATGIADWLYCNSCAHGFKPGEGGTTHGFCPGCLAKRSAELFAELAANRSVKRRHA